MTFKLITCAYYGWPGLGFAKQDRKGGEGVMAAPWNEEATWEREDTMLADYPFLFKEEGMF